MIKFPMNIINLLNVYIVNFKQIWRGSWQGNDIVAKILNVRNCGMRQSRDFKEEYPRLR